jgi:hypothetical protein
VSSAALQVPVQPAPMQVKPLQLVVVTPGQLPLLHWAEFVMTPPAHVCARHCTVGNVQAVREFEQLPAQLPVPVQAVRPVCGAPLTCEHVPSAIVTSHASHCPLQTALQQ